MKEINKIRDISYVEDLYTDLDRLYSTITIQFVIESKDKINVQELRQNIKLANRYCKCANVRLHKYGWIESGKEIPIYEINDSKFNGYNFDQEALFNRKIDYYNNPAIEIFILNCHDINRVIFRVFHGLMDGKGFLIWIENIFKGFKKETLLECNNYDNDVDLLSKNDLKDHELSLSKQKYVNINKSIKYKEHWARITVNNTVPRILSRVLDFFNRQVISDNAKFMIPVDIRRHDKNIINTSNLTFPIFIELNKNDTKDSINSKILYSLKESKELNNSIIKYKKVKHTPKKLRQLVLKWYINRMNNKKSEHMITAIVSHLGKVDLDKLSYNGFKAEAFYSLPVNQPIAPFSVVISEVGDKTEIAVSTSKNIMSNEELYTMLTDLRDDLDNTKIYDKINDTADNNLKYFNYMKEYNDNVKTFPNRAAVICEDRSITYKELDVISNHIAAHIDSNKKVAIHMNRSIDYIACILGIIKAGSMYVPLDVSDLKVRNNEIINEMDYVITDEVNEIAIDDKTKVIFIDDIYKTEGKFEHEYNYVKNKIVYSIFTSGTTGKRKQVRILNSNLSNYLFWCKKYYSNYTDKLNFPFFTSPSVDLTITSIFLPLILGSTIYAYKNNFNNIDIRNILLNEDITCIKLTPTHLKLISEMNMKPKGKKLVIVGGENLDYNLALKSQYVFGSNCNIINEYGPSEATVGCIYHQVIVGKDKTSNSIPIGKPIDNMKIYIFNKDHKLAGYNEMGELYLSGESVFSGYEDETLNETRFIQYNKNKLYKTGDIVKLTTDDELIFCNRVDNQIKINGNRVEIEEIEKKIIENTNLKNIVVLYNADTIICYYIDDNNRIKIPNEISALRDKVPSYMLPKYFVKIDKIPLDTTGKLDKKSLLAIDLKKQNVIQHDMESCDMEKTIKDIVNKYTNEEIVDLNENIYNYGIDSLSMLNIITQISQKYISNEDKQDIFYKAMNEILDNITINKIIDILEKQGVRNG